MRYPEKNYQIKAWRKIKKELPVLVARGHQELNNQSLDKRAILLCSDMAEMASKLEDESIDVIITDPPYGKEDRVYMPIQKPCNDCVVVGKDLYECPLHKPIRVRSNASFCMSCDKFIRPVSSRTRWASPIGKPRKLIF